MNTPKKHHFLPVFYLSRWAKIDGRITEFSKPYRGIVKPRKSHPQGAGYINKLYTAIGLPENIAQDMEQNFLSPVDSRAAVALHLMIENQPITLTHREYWSNFLSTLLSRMPEDIEIYREQLLRLQSILLPEFKEAYELFSSQPDFPSFDIFSTNFIQTNGKYIMDTIKNAMNSDTAINFLQNMQWDIINIPHSKYDLLTSDRPLYHTEFLGNDDSGLLLPIGPKELFVAVKNKKYIDIIKKQDHNKVESSVNLAVVSGAHRYVYGTSDNQIRFIQNRMSTKKPISLDMRFKDFMDLNEDTMLLGIRSGMKDAISKFLSKDANSKL